MNIPVALETMRAALIDAMRAVRRQTDPEMRDILIEGAFFGSISRIQDAAYSVGTRHGGKGVYKVTAMWEDGGTQTKVGLLRSPIHVFMCGPDGEEAALVIGESSTGRIWKRLHMQSFERETIDLDT